MNPETLNAPAQQAETAENLSDQDSLRHVIAESLNRMPETPDRENFRRQLDKLESESTAGTIRENCNAHLHLPDAKAGQSMPGIILVDSLFFLTIVRCKGSVNGSDVSQTACCSFIGDPNDTNRMFDFITGHKLNGTICSSSVEEWLANINSLHTSSDTTPQFP